MPKQRRTQKKRRKQRGGRFVGSGTYGCGFRPALRCADEPTRRRGKFAKLVHQDTAADEFVLRSILFPRDPTRQYFLYPEAICNPARPEAIDETDKCKLIFSDANPARIIIMGKGGKDLQVLKLRPVEYIPFFESLRNVFIGLARLNRDGLAHMDVKPTNIVTRSHADGSFHTRLIDFGLLVDPTRLDELASRSTGAFKNYKVFRTSYLYWPFEVRFLDPVVFNGIITRSGVVDVDYLLEQFYTEFGQERKSVPCNAFADKQLTTRGVEALASPLVPLTRIPLYTAIIAKVDVHGLGVSLSQIYYRFTGHSDIGGIAGPVIAMKASPLTKSLTPVTRLARSASLTPEMITWHDRLAERVSIPLYNLVRDMTHQQPASRPSLEEALGRYEELLPRIAAELTPANITVALPAWMLDAGVLVERAGAGAAAASSSSEVPPSPEYVPLPQPPALPPRSLLQPPVIAAPPAPRSLLQPPVIAAPAPRSAVIPIPPRRNARSAPELIPERRVSSSSAKNNSSYNSSEEHRRYENALNAHLNYNGW